jgi:hypothetical protein
MTGPPSSNDDPGRRPSDSTASVARRSRLRAALHERLGIDPRALAAFRVGLGLVLLADLLLRSRDLVTFYTDAGVLPRSVLWATFPTLSTFSIHTVSGAAWVQGLLFVLAGVCAASLALGYRTRTAALLSWLLLVSLHARNPEVLNGGDSVLRRILFWGVFLPLGSRWSLDARREVGDGWLRSALRPRFGPEGRVVGVAAAGLLVQVVLVYTTNAAFKLDRGAWLGGDAMRHVFELGTFTTPLGAALSTQGALLGAVEAVWLAMVVCSALLVVLRGWPRTLFASLFIGGHLFMFLTMRLGVFPVVSMVSLLPFLPPKVWDAVERAAPSPGALPGAIRPGLGENSRPAGSAPTADAADHGDVTGRLAAVGHGLRTVGAVAGVVLLAVLVVWNAMAVGFLATPDAVNAAVDPTDHSWNMFANPPTADVWLVAPATLESGERVDALHGGAVEWTPPPDGAAWYPNARWRKYAHSVWHTEDEALLGSVAEGLCHRWNSAHEVDAQRVELHVVVEETDFGGSDPIRRSQLTSRECPTGG